MHKNIISTLLVLGLFFQPAFLLATELVKLKLNKSEILYPLPSEFFNITEEIDGIMIAEFLEKAAIPGIPKAQVIFKHCIHSEITGYPWGWIGVNNNVAPRMSQSSVNKFMAKLLDKEDLLDKLYAKVQEKNTEAHNEFGFEVTQNFDQQKILWADDNSLLVAQNMSGTLEGEALEEIIFTSTSVVGDLIVFTYIYNLKDADVSTAEMSKLLISNAAKLIELNF